MKFQDTTLKSTGQTILDLSYELSGLKGEDKKACEIFILEYVALLGSFAKNEHLNQEDLKTKLAKLFEG